MIASGDAVTLAMHIPDNYLSPSTGLMFFVIMIPVWGLCLKYVMTHANHERMAYLGAGAAFSFLIMMFNVPCPGGTTAHAVGGSLIAILLGPQYATIAVSVALLLQALLFGDGGLITFGANCFNMAFVLPFVAYGLYAALRKVLAAGWRERAATFIGAYVGITMAALCVALELGVQPALFRDAAGQALYFPYPVTVSVPAVLIPHLLMASIIEGLVTVVVVEFVRRTAPEIVADSARVDDGAGRGEAKGLKGLRTPVWIGLGLLAVLSPIGLLATGTAYGEWGAEEFKAETGLSYVPERIAHGFSWNALLPDYSMQGLPDWVGYILCAVIGVAVTTIVFRLLAMGVRGGSGSQGVAAAKTAKA
ncbi:cobalt transporter CbiM [Bifidobacterium vansinderenii]|uniref:Cobalt transport protein CbiM n=1 Tax=Bifidobacterium vansinderenii TaxID=1984871 RepID=A0A229VVL7_9BIFI|nr:cobalt transporter CbiM [Bifidobacterium vansinderenii]OXM99667.1 cobalt transport protein CbiM [Bifidobacterium vansinderenii]